MSQRRARRLGFLVFVAPKAVSKDDFEFEKEIADFNIECPICLHVIMDDPRQSLCCGRHFCEACISKVKINDDGSRTCPICRGDCRQTFPDKSFERIVYSKTVYCVKRNHTQEARCDWSGKLRHLRDHLSTSCPYDIVKCEYGCGQEDILRADLTDHLENRCMVRPYSCQHCGAKNTYETITKSHYRVCQYYPVGCSHCSDKNIRRFELNQHVKDKCPMQPVECAFSWLGCKEWPLRKDAKKHYSDSHHEALSQAYQKLRKDADKLRLDTNELYCDTNELRLDTNELRLDTNELFGDANRMKFDLNEFKTDINALYDSLEEKTYNLKAENAKLKDEMDKLINRRCRDLEHDLDDLKYCYNKLMELFRFGVIAVGMVVLLALFLYNIGHITKLLHRTLDSLRSRINY